MNSKEYDRLCMACDRILLAPEATVERMAISWLHVLNEHPALLSRYSHLFGRRRRILPLHLRSMLSLARGLVWRPMGSEADHLPERADVVFVSHLLNESQIGLGEDFYFGTAPEKLRASGLSSCVLLMNWTARASRGLGACWPASLEPRWVFQPTLSVTTELDTRRRLSAVARQLREEGAPAEDAFQRRTYREAASQAMTGSSIFNLRLYIQVRQLVERLRPKAVVVTYEGHAWERLVFAAARQFDPATRCIGYHHTVLFARHHAALRPLGSPYDPDVVLTAGDVTRKRFRHAYEPARTQVATMGMHRRPTPAPNSGPDRGVQRPRACLVIPDGIMSEVVFLFEFALASALAAPDVKFLLRLHPIVPLKRLRETNANLRSLPNNVEFSTKDISEDFGRVRWALYRGSNAAVHGVIAGVRPLYVERPNEMSIDCLHELRVWKQVVRTTDDVARAFRDTSQALDGAETAAEYCKSFFMPPDYSVLVKAIG